MFKVRLRERLFIIFFACFLAIYPPTVKYQEVQALEWAIPTVAFDTAFKFLLGLLGVSITSKALHDNVDWEVVRQDCMDYQIQKGNDAVAVGEWWEDVISGTLNQASNCWSAFKEWVQTKINTPTVVVGEINNAVSVVNYISDYLGYDALCVYDSALVNCYFYSFEISSNGNVDFHCFSSPDSASYSIDGHYIKSSVSPLVREYTGSFNSTTTTFNLQKFTATMSDNKFDFNSTRSKYIFVSPFAVTVTNWNLSGSYEIINAIGGISQPDLEQPFDTVNDNIQDTAITTDDTTTTAIPDTLPLPWDNVSDTAEGVADSIDALQEQVAEGVLSLEEYWEKIQEMLDALAVDTTTEETLPVTENPDTGETEKIEDIANENVSNYAFTLNGLEKVFPFCIPWDIYGFVTLLVAEPVAPVINYPIYNPVTEKNIDIIIDFSDWETVVVLFRYILDFLLIIGLLLLARQLSGAGGDD